MKKTEIIALIRKIGGRLSKIKTPKDAKKEISRVLEEDGIPEDAELIPEEIVYIESLGFEVEAIEEEEEEPIKKKSKKEKPEKKTKKKNKKELSQVEPEKKSKKEKSEKKTGKRVEKREAFINCMTKFIDGVKKGRTREEIADHIKKKMPEWADTTVLAYISTGKNKKLCRFEKILVEDDKRRLTFKK